MPIPGPSFDALRLARLRSRLNGYLTDTLTNSRFTKPVTAATWSANVATLTSAAHGYSIGQTVLVAGITPGGYNGTVSLTAVTTNTFSYALVGNPGSGTVFGTVTAVSRCRVAADTRELHYEGLGRLIESRRWRIVQAYGDPLAARAGDVLTVPNGGTYAALEILSPTTNSVSCTCFALQQRQADGTLNLLTNTTVQVTGANDTVALPVTMLLQPISEDAILRNPDLLQMWECAWDPLVTLPSGNPISAGDRIDWTANGAKYHGNLRLLRPNIGPVIHVSAYIDRVVAG